MSDLIERLGRAARYIETDRAVPYWIGGACQEAADEIERLQAQLAEARLNWKLCEDQLLALRAELTEARGTLQELRIRLHAAGRRPEECYEMGLIDDALAKHKEQPVGAQEDKS